MASLTSSGSARSAQATQTRPRPVAAAIASAASGPWTASGGRAAGVWASRPAIRSIARLAAEGQRRRADAAQAPAARGVVDRRAEQDAGQAVGQHERAVGQREAVGRDRQPHGAERAQPLVRPECDEHVGDRHPVTGEQARGRARGGRAGGRRRRQPAERRAELGRQLAQRDRREDRALELVEPEPLAGQPEAHLDTGDAAARRRARGRGR